MKSRIVFNLMCIHRERNMIYNNCLRNLYVNCFHIVILFSSNIYLIEKLRRFQVTLLHTIVKIFKIPILCYEDTIRMHMVLLRHTPSNRCTNARLSEKLYVTFIRSIPSETWRGYFYLQEYYIKRGNIELQQL